MGEQRRAVAEQERDGLPVLRDSYGIRRVSEEKREGETLRDKRMDARPTAEHEMALIRIGHHLWRSYKRKEWPEPGISISLQTVWDAKEEIRRPLRAAWLESWKKLHPDRVARMAKARAGRAQS
jgi:hypothetical protein